LHGEQGALLVASQLVTCAPTFDAKLYAASQAFDEARHVEVFSKLINERIGFMYPINPSLKLLMDKILTDERWDLKFIGMQLIIESLALASFNTEKTRSKDPVIRDALELVTLDESRHVAFGILYLESFIKTLSPAEIEDRARFAYEACVVMYDRILGTDVLEHFGWDVEEGRRRLLQGGMSTKFQGLLFSRIMPNLKKVGLLTDSVRPLYEKLGILKFEDFEIEAEVDWAKLENDKRFQPSAY